MRFQWRKNGGNIAGATNESLTLNNILSTAGGSYAVFVSNIAGSRLSSNAVLKVFVPPKFARQPANLSVTLSNRVTFAASASGTVPLFYQWWLDGEAISGATNLSYTIPKVLTNQAGIYTVTVSNFAGVRMSTNAQLRVIVPPTFQVQPQAQFAIVGPTNLTFFAAASGTGPLRFQWRRNGGNISGATNASYTLTNITPTSGGAFSVSVANAAKSVISSNAMLKVFVPPAFTSTSTAPKRRTASATTSWHSTLPNVWPDALPSRQRWWPPTNAREVGARCSITGTPWRMRSKSPPITPWPTAKRLQWVSSTRHISLVVSAASTMPE